MRKITTILFLILTSINAYAVDYTLQPGESVTIPKSRVDSVVTCMGPSNALELAGCTCNGNEIILHAIKPDGTTRESSLGYIGGCASEIAARPICTGTAVVNASMRAGCTCNGNEILLHTLNVDGTVTEASLGYVGGCADAIRSKPTCQ